jgi:uncharacterized phage infection (PIP) family protein YhgE
MASIDASSSIRLADRIHACEWAVLVGLHDPLVARELHALNKKLLVIQPNSLLADRLLEDWEESILADVEICREIVGADQRQVRWHCFNDPRLDGPQPLQELQARFTNLSLRGQEMRQQQTLTDVMQSWWGSHGEPSGLGALVMEAVEPLPILTGAKAVLSHFQTLILPQETPAGEDQASILQLQELLENECFHRLPGGRDAHACWQLDLARLHQREREHLQHEIADLQNTNSELSNTLHLCQEDLSRLKERYSQLAELESTNKQRLEEVRSVHSQLQVSHDKLQATQQQTELQLQNITEERDKLQILSQELERENQEAAADIQRLTTENSTLQGNHQQLCHAHDQLEENYRALREQIEDVAQSNQQLQSDYDQAIASMKTMEGENIELKAVNHELKTRQSELSRLTTHSDQQLSVIMELFVDINTGRSKREEW